MKGPLRVLPCAFATGLRLDPAGERLIAVGLGRYAYVFNAKSRKLCEQVRFSSCVLAAAAGACVYATEVKQITQVRVCHAMQVFLKQKLTCLLAAGGESAGGIRQRAPTKEQTKSENNSDRSDASESELEIGNDSDSDNSTDSSATTEGDSRQTAERFCDQKPSGAFRVTGKRKNAPDNQSTKRKRANQPAANAGKPFG